MKQIRVIKDVSWGMKDFSVKRLVSGELYALDEALADEVVANGYAEYSDEEKKPKSKKDIVEENKAIESDNDDKDEPDEIETKEEKKKKGRWGNK